MGTSYQLYFADYLVHAVKGEVDSVEMTIFREADKRVFTRKVSERNSLWWDHVQDNDSIETVYEYSNSIANIKQRLEVMGFTLSKVRREFDKVIQEQLENVTLNRARRPWHFDEHFLENTKFDNWLHALNTIFEKKLRWRNSTDVKNPLIEHLLDGSFWYSFPHYDYRCFLRAFAEICPDDARVILDITELVANGYYYPDDEVCNLALKRLSNEYSINEKTIILTEGSTDKLILEQSLLLLYPHIFEYFSFMDFSSSNAPGGASNLVSTIKAFAGSGINNRVVALFDNDTAAQVALRGLSKTVIPNNLQILRYPGLEFAKCYPTLGPSGITELDINGLACSIELYLGIDILTQDGELAPIQWRGYDHTINQYQGEIMGKKQLQERFLKKATECKDDISQLEKTDWTSLRLLWQTVFHAFD